VRNLFSLLPSLFCILISTSLLAQPDAVIKQSSTKYIISGKEKLEIIKELVIQINAKEGFKHAIFVDYHDKFKKITQLDMTVLDKNGEKVKKLGKNRALNIKFNNSYEIDDSRLYILEPDYKQFPFTVEISSKAVYNGFISLPTWSPAYDYNMEVHNSSLEVEYPTGYQIKFLEENILPHSIKTSESSETLKWKIDKLDATSRETSRTNFQNSQPKVHLTPLEFELEGVRGSFSSWQTFGDWFLALNNGRDQLLRSTKLYLDSLKGTQNDDMINEIYHYMQDRTRYVSIQLGIGGFQTVPSDIVETTGYGDCKALTNYMKAMLNYVGITSNYILVKAGKDAEEVKSEFPSNQFNHVFLGIPLKNDTILLECTSQIVPSNYIGTFTDNRNVLWVDSLNSKIITSRKYGEMDNQRVTTGTIKMAMDGRGEISAITSNKGIFYDDLMRFKYNSNEEIKQYYYNKFRYNDFLINNISYSEISRDSIDFEIQFDLSVNHLAKASGKKILIPLNLWLPVESYFTVCTISSSVEIQRAFRISNEFEISIPNEFWQKEIPSDVFIESHYGNYSVSIKRIDEKYVIRRELILNKGMYEGEDFEFFSRFLRKIKNADNSKIVLDSET
jgi:hypothetical protein